MFAAMEQMCGNMWRFTAFQQMWMLQQVTNCGRGVTHLTVTKEVNCLEKDPVCGMQVDSNKVKDKSQYQGKTYYFCCAQCKQKFDSEPQQYAQK
jgi:YHS domain-containing protein